MVLFMPKTAPKGVENPMFFLPQSVEKSPPIGFPLRGIRGGIETAFPCKTNAFPNHWREEITYRYSVFRIKESF